MRSDLVITFNDGTPLSTAEFRGHVAILAVLKLNTCHAGQSMQLIDQVFRELRERGVRSVGCIVDLEPGQKIPEFPASPGTPIGTAPRRRVADYLGLPMSGFRLPQFVVLDHVGRPRRRCVLQGMTFIELVQSLRTPVEELLDELSTDAVQVFPQNRGVAK
jgi:hypothetical protein